ncbi:MAG: hypothetical protein HY823_03310 [Acidobacteria bacterium]|nr:hypothetical protein [Acidobacteriota bacterium]
MRPLLPRLLLFTLLGIAARSQDPALQEAHQQAKALWSNQGDREGASAKFEHVVAALSPKGKDLADSWRQVLCEALNWLAVLDDRSPAQKARALQNLEAILDLDPDFEIDRSLTPARLQAQFDGLRATRLVKLRLVLQPEGGSLLMDGRPTAPAPSKFVPLGDHVLTYSKPGFAPVEKRLRAEAKDTPSVEFNLVRTSSTLRLHLSPVGTEVLLDGRSLGRAGGSAPADLAPLAAKAGVRLEDLSGPFLVSELKPGRHILEFRAPCHRPKKVAIPEEYTQTFQDVTLEPYGLESSKGALSVSSAWEGGELFLDGTSRGTLPQQLPLCPGTYQLEVRFPSGGFAQTLEIQDGKTLPVLAKPKPRLAFVGSEADPSLPGMARLLQQASTLGGRLTELAYFLRAGEEGPREILARLRAARGAELFLRFAPGREGGPSLDAVVSTPEGEEERLSLRPLEQDPLGALAARLNRFPSLEQNWGGIVVADFPGEKGPWVLQAEEAALRAGLQVNASLQEVNQVPLASAADFRAAVDRAQGESLTIVQGGKTFKVPLTLAPVELPVADPQFSYPAVLATLRLKLLGAKGEAAAQLRFQQALAWMHFRKWEKAVEALREIRMTSLQGVSQGTVEYYTGLCLLRLGTTYIPEAIQAFTQAQRYPRATLFGPDGPSVAPLAKQAVEDQRLN